VFDPFDLGDKNQRGTVATRYGTKAELQRMVVLAHRFGLRVYFDNIMNHRANEVPGYDANTPTNLYPGLVPGDFHVRVTAQGFYRNWPNVSDWGNVFQVQNRPLVGLLDLAHETPNANFGATEGSTASKPSFVRHPGNPEYYDVNSAGIRVGFGHVTAADLSANPNAFREDVGAYLLRSVRYLIDQARCDGLRLDAVKHVPSYFFGQQSGTNRDESDAGYLGAAQVQFDLTHGFTDSNHRNSNFDTELTRNDALLFGEHLGEPPGFNEYLDAGMRLLDNPLRSYLNDVLGNPGRSLAGLEQRDFGGFSAGARVMHAQSHDNDFANHRELHNAFYFFREGVPLIYSDGYNESPGSGGSAFPRHANAPYLGQFGDGKMPDLAYLHHQLARGGTRSRWGDSDVCAFERFDYREAGSAADQTVVLFAMNDNYGNPGDISFDDGVTQSDTDMPSTCYRWSTRAAWASSSVSHPVHTSAN
jgi:glycosidase